MARHTKGRPNTRTKLWQRKTIRSRSGENTMRSQVFLNPSTALFQHLPSASRIASRSEDGTIGERSALATPPPACSRTASSPSLLASRIHSEAFSSPWSKRRGIPVKREFAIFRWFHEFIREKRIKLLSLHEKRQHTAIGRCHGDNRFISLRKDAIRPRRLEPFSRLACISGGIPECRKSSADPNPRHRQRELRLPLRRHDLVETWCFCETIRGPNAPQPGRARYKLRQQTVEPVFGIIKEAMGLPRAD